MQNRTSGRMQTCLLVFFILTGIGPSNAGNILWDISRGVYLKNFHMNERDLSVRKI